MRWELSPRVRPASPTRGDVRSPLTARPGALEAYRRLRLPLANPSEWRGEWTARPAKGELMSGWRLTLLGGFELRGATGETVPLSGRKTLALLAFLALQPGQRAPRSRLITLLWGDVPDAQARTSLRQALAAMRRNLEGLLESEGDAVALSPGALATDVAAFEAALAEGTAESLEDAAFLYRGELLGGVALPGADFADWLAVERERLRAEAVGALGRLLEQALAGGDAEAGVRTALRLVALDPLQEPAHRALMRFYARQGRQAAALKQYETLRTLLQDELNVQPDAETEQLRREIRESRRTAPASTARPTAADSPVVPPEAEPAPVAAPDRQPQAPLERRQATVLACGLVDAADQLAGDDPEAAHDLITCWRRLGSEVAAGLGGTLVRTMADTLLIGFGYPGAHEDDAERAVRAALRLIERMPAAFPGHALRLRAGIATSLVIAGAGADAAIDGALSFTGEAVGLAQRLMGRAAPGSVVIEWRTRRLCAGSFSYAALGSVPVDGPAQAVEAWHVLGESGVAGRFAALQGGALTPFVGRDEEIELLLRRWQQATSRQGRVVLISGEPGVGKSRLALAFQERIAAEPPALQHYFCSALRSGSPLHPVIAGISRAAGLADGDEPRVQRTKLAAYLGPRTASANDVDLIVDLFALSDGAPSPAPGLTPQRRKEETLDALLRHLAWPAHDGPVVILLEDAHWIDQTTLELLDLAVYRISRLPVLLIVTSRPEFASPWAGVPQVTTIALNRLGRDDCAALMAGVTGGKALPDRITQEILGRTDGVPLFTEELTKAVLESGLLKDDGAHYSLKADAPALAIPTTLHASLLARLDRWPTARPVAQAAAALGRDFSHGLLAAICAVPEPEVQLALDQLVAAELISRRGTPPDSTYRFKHALVQEVAYGTLLRVPREQLHVRIVQALEERFPAIAAAEPGLLAHHCGRAGLPAKAIDYWCTAAQRSFARWSMEEAQAKLAKGFDLLPDLIDADLRLDKEIELQLTQAHALRTGISISAPQAGEAYERARILCEQARDERRMVPAVYGSCLFHLNRAELEQASSRAEDLVRHIPDRASPSAAMTAYQSVLGLVDLQQGRLLSARTRLQTLPFVVETTDQWLKFGTGPDPNTIVHLGWTLCLLGHLDDARAQAERARALMHRSAHAQRQCAVLANSCYLEQFCGRTQAVQALAEEVLPLASEKGFSPFRGAALFFRGWALVQQQEVEPEARLALMREGLAAYRGETQQIKVPYFLTLMAEATAKAGRAGEALELLDDAFGLMERTGERWYAAEAHRLKADILLGLPSRDEGAAEAEYLRAIDIARQQDAKLWQLRAATALARLWRDQGKPGPARDLLAPVCAAFTQGLDIPHVREAKALLDELG